MAGDWIKLETTTPDKPEVFRMADELDLDPDAALGKLVRVWVWADQQTVDGNAVSVTQSLLDRIAGVTGFAKAMMTVGWLTESKDGFAFPNFDRHNGQSAKTRANTQRRVSKHRNATGVTKPLPEKRRDREENKEKKPKKADASFGPLSMELPFSSAEFRSAWSDYAAMRREIKKPLVPTAAKNSVANLKAMGEARAIAALRHTTANQWQGIREPDAPSGSRSVAPAADPLPELESRGFGPKRKVTK